MSALNPGEPLGHLIPSPVLSLRTVSTILPPVEMWRRWAGLPGAIPNLAESTAQQMQILGPRLDSGAQIPLGVFFDKQTQGLGTPQSGREGAAGKSSLWVFGLRQKQGHDLLPFQEVPPWRLSDPGQTTPPTSLPRSPPSSEKGCSYEFPCCLLSATRGRTPTRKLLYHSLLLPPPPAMGLCRVAVPWVGKI